jgi:predicted transcriptional regulator of viral defense system
MSVVEIIDGLVKSRNGYLLTSDIVNLGISKTYMYQYIKNRNMEKVAHGIYVTLDTWVDDMYIINLRNKNIVYSHETALYIHNLIDSEPTQIMITVKDGYNATHLRNLGYNVFTVSESLILLGAVKKETIYGNEISVYDMDRTICDMIRYKNRFEIQTFQTAIKEYMRSKDKNVNNLMKYAEKLKVISKVRLYTEVMI